MLNKVEVRTDQGDLLTLPMQDVSEGYIIQEIDGLTPVKATIVSSSFAQMDGEQYQSARREKRNIVMKLDLEPDYTDQTVWGLRQRLYEFFMPKSNVNLRFFVAGVPPVDISGRVESFDSDLWSAEPTVSLSILCFNPDFYDPTPVVVPGVTVADDSTMPIEYEGTVETGIKFSLAVNRTISGFTIYHTPPSDELRSLAFAYPLLNGDVVEISTIRGSKYATLIRAGVGTSVLYGISPYANWIELEPGTNQIRVLVSGAAIPYTIEYTKKYGGL